MFKLKNQQLYLQIERLYHKSGNVTKRLGDGFYEQKLIREQINQLTGRRFLSGYANDQAQYQASVASMKCNVIEVRQNFDCSYLIKQA